MFLQTTKFCDFVKNIHYQNREVFKRKPNTILAQPFPTANKLHLSQNHGLGIFAES